MTDIEILMGLLILMAITAAILLVMSIFDVKTILKLTEENKQLRIEIKKLRGY